MARKADHHKKIAQHLEKAHEHLNKLHESAKMKKEHEAEAGKKYNRSAKHHEAEARGMKKAMKKK